MTDTDQSSYQNRTSHEAPSGWTGWVAFTGILMIMAGFFQAIVGLVALFDDGYYADRNELDYEEFVKAIRSGRLEALEGV